MPAAKETIISRDDMVLVVVDIQSRLADVMPKRDTVIEATSKLVRVAALVGAPIIVTRQYPKGLGDTVDELQSELVALAEQGHRVTSVDKTTFCCAAEPEFMEALAGTGRKQVVLVGMETHICITQTALALAGSGYQVQVVANGVCSIDEGNHAIALNRLQSAGVVITTSESVMYEAVERAGTDEFKGLLQIVKS